MILLDTCALLWLVNDPKKLSTKATQAIKENSMVLHVNAITFWEIGYKQRLGKLKINNFSVEEWSKIVTKDYRIKLIDINSSIALCASSLELHHRDPCDRFIIASALEHKLPIVTTDEAFHNYPVKIIW